MHWKISSKDYIGSTCQTLNTSGVVQSAMDYYAFGGTMSSYVNGNTVDKYKFTGKERDTETGLDYFGARYYDSKIGRWMSVDPLAEKYPGLSPYNYSMDDPINNIDPDGTYTIHGNLFRRWTLDGARAWKKMESLPVTGIFDQIQRAMINDASFRPSFAENASAVGLFLSGKALSKVFDDRTSSIPDILGQAGGADLTLDEESNLKIDEMTFESMKTQTEDGVSLAIEQTTTKFGDAFGSFMIMNPNLAKVWGKKYGWSYEDAQKEFEKRVASERSKQGVKYRNTKTSRNTTSSYEAQYQNPN